MRFLHLSIFAAGLLFVTAALAAPAGSTPKPKPASPPPRPPLFRDTAKYPLLKLTWNVRAEMKQVRGVFPHPILPRRAVLATAAGLSLTDDAGQTWIALPEVTAKKVGPIHDVAFHRISTDTFYIASETQGVWATSDKGKTFQQIGTKAKGMASDTVVSFIVYPGDATGKTLLAAHGEETAGLSRSHDGGQTWDVVNADYCFRRLLGGGGQFYAIASATKEPDIQNLYVCHTVGEFMLELIRDVVPTDMAAAPTPYGRFGTIYLATSDSGLYRIDNTRVSHDVKPLEWKGVDGWASVAVTWGPTADVMNLYLYDPSKLGLVVSGDNLASIHTASNGLLVSSLIKEGSVIRPNANGTVFYAVANASLSQGRTSEDVPVVDFTPPVVELLPNDEDVWQALAGGFQNFARAAGSTVAAAKALSQGAGDLERLHRESQLTVTARLPLQPAPPASVTVDLSRFTDAPRAALFDDGQHHDGAAGDGTYGFTFTFLPKKHRPPPGDREWRTSWPGRIAMGVTATFADGRHEGAVGLVGVYPRVGDLDLWPRGLQLHGADKNIADAEGEVAVEASKNPPEIHNGSPALRIAARKGAWSVSMKVKDKTHSTITTCDSTSYEAVSFWVRVSEGEPPKELYAQLRDKPAFSLPTTTERVPVLQGTTLDADYQRVVIPLSRLLGPASQFKKTSLSRIILSGDGTAPATLFIDGLQLLAMDEGSKPADPSSK